MGRSNQSNATNENEDLITARTRKRYEDLLNTNAGDWQEGMDPVKMYLRRIGQVSLLTREGEVEIAMEIEAGRDIIFEHITSCRAGQEMILAIPDKLKAGTSRAREVFDEYEPAPEGSELPVAEAVFKRFDKVRRYQKQLVTAANNLAEEPEGDALA